MTQIRSATRADIGTIMRFVRELAAFEREPDAVEATEATLGEALFGDAVDDFLHETTRQKPWLRARFEAQLKGLNAYLDSVLDGPAPLKALSKRRADAWLRGLNERTTERALAERALAEFADYLVKWGWLPSHPLERPPAV